MSLLIGSIVLTVITFVIVLIGRIVYRSHKDFTPEISISKYDSVEDRELKNNKAKELGKPRKRKFDLHTLLYCVFSLGWLALLLFGTFTKVNANEVGIIYDDRYGVLEEVKYEGFQTKSVFEHITKISTTNKTTQITVSGQTNDSAYADFSVTVVYKIEAVNAGKFYKVTSDKDIATEQLTSMVKEALQSSTIKYDIYSILGDKLEEVRIDFTNNLTEILLERYSITVVSTSFDDIDAGERIENIIKNKAEALQQIEIAEAEKQKANVEVETEKIKAEAAANVAKIQAEAEAEVIKIGADAEAYKVETEKTAITDMIDLLYEKYADSLSYSECAEIVLQTIFYEKWDGKLPEVLTNDSLSSLIGSLIQGE